MTDFENFDDVLFDWLPNASDDEVEDYFFDTD